MRSAVFLDRDGVINRKAPEGEYITRWEDLEILPGVAASVRQIKEADLKVVVVTNQRCVAKGILTEIALQKLHERLIDQLAQDGAIIDGIYYCPHDKTAGCSCRKPAAGMLVQAAQEHEIDLKGSWMVGDSPSDILAGKNAGCRTIFLKTRDDLRAATIEGEPVTADKVASSLLEAVQQILPLTK